MRAAATTSIGALLALVSACGSGTTTTGGGDGTGDGTGGGEGAAREQPPASGQARDVSFPPIARTATESGLEVNTVRWDQLPIVYLRLVVKSGGETDPDALPGLAHVVGAMLKEGTRTRTSAQLAEQIEFLGADMWVEDDEENVTIGMRALADQLDQAMDLLADVATSPAFSDTELRKLKRREQARLALQENDPGYLASRAFYRHLYGEHPYAHIDTTSQALDRMRRTDLSRWHQQHFVPNNAVLVAVGAVDADAVQASAARAFARWRRGDVPETDYPEPPARTAREVVLVDRPESVQSVIYVGNLALERASADYVPLRVANQVLGGSAASRLFMDLRERRSLTYGAYSRVGESVRIAPFSASASVRNEVTAEAMTAFFEHLDRIVAEPAPEAELDDAKRYLSDRFPLDIDTPGKIAYLVADLRVYGLPDDYWDGYRSAIRGVAPDRALAAARQYVHPDQMLVVVVGKGTDVIEGLRRWGPVTVYDTAGNETQRLEQTPAQ